MLFTVASFELFDAGAGVDFEGCNKCDYVQAA